MTVGELKDLLEDMDDDVEVRLMTQENYPFENAVQGCCLRSEMHGEDEEEEAESVESQEEILYIVEGRQIGYGSKTAWDLC